MKRGSPSFTLIEVMLAVAVLALGIYPKPLTDVMGPSVKHLVEQVTASKLPESAP